MYTHLLENYATNSARTNHYILSFMMRLSNFKVRSCCDRHTRLACRHVFSSPIFNARCSHSLYIPLGIPEAITALCVDHDPFTLSSWISLVFCIWDPQRGEVWDRRRGKSTDKAQADHVSLEPMLYNIYTLRVFQKILDNPVSRKNTFKHLVNYIL